MKAGIIIVCTFIGLEASHWLTLDWVSTLLEVEIYSPTSVGVWHMSAQMFSVVSTTINSPHPEGCTRVYNRTVYLFSASVTLLTKLRYTALVVGQTITYKWDSLGHQYNGHLSHFSMSCVRLVMWKANSLISPSMLTCYFINFFQLSYTDLLNNPFFVNIRAIKLNNKCFTNHLVVIDSQKETRLVPDHALPCMSLVVIECGRYMYKTSSWCTCTCMLLRKCLWRQGQWHVGDGSVTLHYAVWPFSILPWRPTGTLQEDKSCWLWHSWVSHFTPSLFIPLIIIIVLFTVKDTRQCMIPHC